MKINLQSINKEDFNIKEGRYAFTDVVLVTPKAFPKWDNQNKYFRSSVWDLDGNLVFPMYRKFTNEGEQPDFEPLDTKSTLYFNRKLDGSLLGVTNYKGHLLTRTRGTFDARTLDNGHEIDFLKQKYPKVFDNTLIENGATLLLEWTTPTNVIVYKESEEPKLWLLGVINHLDYLYFPQPLVDKIAVELQVERPEQYYFENLQEAIQNVGPWKGKEGIVVHGNNYQYLKKIKAELYCKLHHLVSELSSQDKVVEVYAEMGFPSYNDFMTYLYTTFEFEIVERIKGSVSRICDAMKEVNKITSHMENFVLPLKQVLRKEAALKITEAYGETNRASFCFTLLNNKPLEIKDKKKLLYQVLK